jgi:hypothetical protein
MESMYTTVTIRKPDTKSISPSMILSTVDIPPSLSQREIRTYYNNTFEYTFSDNTVIADNDDICTKITKIYNYINKNTQYNVNYGDIIEFQDGTFYFFHLTPILID